MPSQQGLDFGASAGMHRIELGHDLAPAHDREVLTSVLYCIEDVGEVPCRIGSTHIRHEIILSDTTLMTSSVTETPFVGGAP